MAELGQRAEGVSEGAIDPSSIGDRREFAAKLSTLRERAGKSIRALARAVDQPAATIGGYFSGQHLPGVSQTELFRNVLRQLGVADGPHIEGWVDALVRVRSKRGPRRSDSPSPYRGLESFRAEDAKWFFGRETLTDAVVRRVFDSAKDSGSGSILVVVGPSGSGKSSLLTAGVLPAIRGAPGASGAPWRAVLLRPGTEPVRRLAEGLAAEFSVDEGEIEARMRSTPAAWRPMAIGSPGLVVFIDQFEEVFTCCDEAERRSIVAVLADNPPVAATPQCSPTFFILGLRADFYGRAAQEPALVPALQNNQLIVGAMTVDELRRVITEPARIAGMAVDQELVDLLITEGASDGARGTPGSPGALPLLSHALRETWERARRGRMTVADYRATGGIAEAVQHTAERTFAELTTEEQRLARRIFLRMVNVDDEVPTRRRVPRSELPGCMCEDAPRVDCPLECVIDRFVAHRLLTVQATTIEVSHEALLAAWPRLREWVDADRAGLRTHRQLGDAARAWVEDGRDPADLLRGGRLEIAGAWACVPENRSNLNRVEQSFLDASDAEARRQESSARHRMRRLQCLLVVVATLALVAGVLAEVAVRSRVAAESARNTALSRQLAIQATRLRETDPNLAMQLSLIAYRTSRTSDARSALLDSSAIPSATRLLGQPGATALAVSRDEQMVAVSRANEGTVQLFSLATERIPVREGVLQPPTVGHDLFAVTFSPDGRIVATGGTENVVRLWDVADRAHPKQLSEPLLGFTDPVHSLAFSPDGSTLVAGGGATGVLRWDVTDPGHPKSLPPLTGMTGTTQAVIFSPNGEMVAAGGTDGIVRIWMQNEARPPIEFGVGDTTVNAVVFSPDGRFVAAGSKDKTIRVWDIGPGRSPAEIVPALTGFGSWVNALAFSDDGQVLAGGSSDNTIRFWQVDSWSPLEPTLTGPSPVTGVILLRGADEVVSVATDGVASIWNWPGPVIAGPRDTVFGLSYSADGSRLAVFPNHADRIDIWNASDPQHPVNSGRIELPPGIGTVSGTGAISPDGRVLAAGTTTFKVQLWDITDLAAPVLLGPALEGFTKLIEQVAFSVSSGLMVGASDDGSVRLWDVRTPAEPRPLSTLTGPDNHVLGLGLSRDGRLLAAASADRSVWLWNIEDPERPEALATITGFDNYAYSVAFSPDSKVLATGSADKSVRLWAISDPRHPRLLGDQLTGPGNYVYTLGFESLRGDVLAAAVPDGSVWLWDVHDPERAHVIATLTAATSGQVFVAAYSPDGLVLAAADDRSVRLWSTDPDRISARICATAGDRITPQEWLQYVPDRPYDPPCA
jgi:WD40 repeat protein/energy-coupling factor transporter ATP-binding protein EcfA2